MADVSEGRARSEPRNQEDAPESRSVTVLAVMEQQKASIGGSGKKGGRPAKVEKKKEFDFLLREGRDAHQALLRAILERHGQTRYRINTKKPFSIQALVPPHKA